MSLRPGLEERGKSRLPPGFDLWNVKPVTEVYLQNFSGITEENHKEPYSERGAGFETRSCRNDSVIMATFNVVIQLYNINK